MKQCTECALPSPHHILSWTEGIVAHLLPYRSLGWIPLRVQDKIFTIVEHVLRTVGVLSLENAFDTLKLPIRARCFIEQAISRGMRVEPIRGPFGYTDTYFMTVGNRRYSFEGLPVADFLSHESCSRVSDKELTKERLKDVDFPVLPGRSFWFFEKAKARSYGEAIGYPLVVKPRDGTFSRHVTTNIRTTQELKRALESAITYSPTYMVEKYLENSFVHRATIVDGTRVAVARRTLPRVVGDGILTIADLITVKNSDPNRDDSDQSTSTLFKIVIDSTTHELLQESGRSMDSVPARGEVVFLQRDPFIRLGADVEEVTSEVHEDNIKLFIDIATYFNMRVVGIDFLCVDITKSWREQESAILELNAIPCIEVHHFPSSGVPQNVGGWLTDLVEKYY